MIKNQSIQIQHISMKKDIRHHLSFAKNRFHLNRSHSKRNKGNLKISLGFANWRKFQLFYKEENETKAIQNLKKMMND